MKPEMIGTMKDTMDSTIQSIIDKLEHYAEAAESMGQMLLGNLVMVGEIPAPTFHEEKRIRFLHDRFVEIGLSNISTDEAGNAFGILDGTEGKKNILVVAHTDTEFPISLDHTVRLLPGEVRGVGVANNSLSVAALATLPRILAHAGVALKANLILMGSAQSLGRGNLAGLRFFVKNSKLPISTAICVEGVELGRLSYYATGMIRGEIRCTVPDEYDWSRFGVGGAIYTLNEVIDAIAQVPFPQRPRTTVNIGFIQGGTSFSTLAKRAFLRFEIRSESAEMVETIHGRISEIVAEVSSRSGAALDYDVVARRNPVGLPFSHPLPTIASRIMTALGVQTRIHPSLSELSVLLSANIPAVTIGLTHVEHLDEPDETIMIPPIYRGIAQLMGILEAADSGCCDQY